MTVWLLLMLAQKVERLPPGEAERRKDELYREAEAAAKTWKTWTAKAIVQESDPANHETAEFQGSVRIRACDSTLLCRFSKKATLPSRQGTLLEGNRPRWGRGEEIRDGLTRALEDRFEVIVTYHARFDRPLARPEYSFALCPKSDALKLTIREIGLTVRSDDFLPLRIVVEYADERILTIQLSEIVKDPKIDDAHSSSWVVDGIMGP